MIKRIFIPCLFLLLLSCEKSNNNELLKFYGDAYENLGNSIAKNSSGYYIAGQYTRIDRTSEGIKGSLKKLSVIETDLNGKQLRIDTTSTSLASCGNKVLSSEDGSLVVAGYVTDSQGQQDIYVVKFAPGGEGTSEKIYTMDGNQAATDIIKTAEGYLILGTTDALRGATGDLGNAKGKKDMLFLRVSNSLDLIAAVPAGFVGNDTGVAVKARGNGFIVVGTTDRYNSQTGLDVFILSSNADISTTMFRFFEKAGTQAAADFEVMDDGFLIAGNNSGQNGEMTGFAWKVTGDILGTLTSENEISFGSEATTINAICPYKTSSFLMAGQYGSASSGSMLIFATDLLGYPVEGRTKIAGGTGSQSVQDVISEGEDIMAVGRNSYENNSMITLLKFRF